MYVCFWPQHIKKPHRPSAKPFTRGQSVKWERWRKKRKKDVKKYSEKGRVWVYNDQRGSWWTSKAENWSTHTRKKGKRFLKQNINRERSSFSSKVSLHLPQSSLRWCLLAYRLQSASLANCFTFDICVFTKTAVVIRKAVINIYQRRWQRWRQQNVKYT